MDCPSLCSSELFYRSSGKKYPDLIPHLLDPKVHELLLNPMGLFCASSNDYVSLPLKEQMLFLMSEILRIHDPKHGTIINHSFSLKKKSCGLFRLDHAAQMGFYREGVLDLSIAGDKNGLLYVYTPDNKIYLNYIEFYYYFGIFN